MHYFKYGSNEIKHLTEVDQRLGALIKAVGPIKRPVEPDLFKSLMHLIIGQQISSAAQQTIWQRLLLKLPKVTPESILALSAAELQSCGLTWRKVAYMQNAAEKVLTNELPLAKFKDLSDEEIITELIKLKGIGVWTAEMLLIFSLERPNIISYLDLAIIRGMKRLYQINELPKSLFLKYKDRYSPYASVASLYLWHQAVNDLLI